MAKDSCCSTEESQNTASGVRRLLVFNVILIPRCWVFLSALDLYINTFFSRRCFAEDTCITIPDIDAVVMVLQPSEPRITITGVERLTRPASDFRASGGVVLFQDLHIISTVTRADATAHHPGTDCHSEKYRNTH